jgi:MFS family permease
VLSRTGDQLTTIALVWFVLDLTGSSMSVGLVLLCAGLPPVATGPLLGRLLDRWPLRRVLLADNLLRAGLVGAIPTLYWLDRLNMPLVYGLTLAAGALLPATQAGVRVALPRLVDDEQLDHANVLVSIGDQVSALVGPAVGGLLVGLVGAPPVLLLDAVSFLAMAALVGPLPDTPTTTATPPPAPSSPTRLLLADPTVRAVLALTLVYFLFLAGGPFESALPLYGRDVLHAGALGLRPALVGVRGRRAARPGDRPHGQPPAPWPRPGRQRAAVGRDPAAPAPGHHHRPGDAHPGPGWVGVGAVHHP